MNIQIWNIKGLNVITLTSCGVSMCNLSSSGVMAFIPGKRTLTCEGSLLITNILQPGGRNCPKPHRSSFFPRKRVTVSCSNSGRLMLGLTTRYEQYMKWCGGIQVICRILDGTFCCDENFYNFQFFFNLNMRCQLRATIASTSISFLNKACSAMIKVCVWCIELPVDSHTHVRYIQLYHIKPTWVVFIWK